MKRIILHIGLPKTGTSALQVFWRNNRDTLKKSGIGFYSASHMYYGSIQIANGAFLLRDAMDRLGVFDQTEKGRLMEDVKGFCAYAADFDTLILTDERHHRSSVEYPGLWHAIRDCLHAYFGEEIVVDIVVYLRRQDAWIMSLWKQYMHTALPGRRPINFLPFLNEKEADGYLDYEEQLGRIEDVFGREHLIVRAYDRSAFSGGDIFHDFHHAAGIPWQNELATNEEIINPSLTLDAANAVYLIRDEKTPYKIDDKSLRLAAETYSLMYPESEHYYPMEENARRELVARYKESNRRVEERYMKGQTFCDTPKSQFKTRLAELERDLENARIIAQLARAPKKAHAWIRQHQTNFHL